MILCLEMTGGDYLQSQVYDGLVSLFGRKEVIDFPEDKEFVRCTRKAMDSGYQYSARHFIYEDEFYNDTDGGLRGWTHEQILMMAKEGKFTLAVCGYQLPLAKYLDILQHIPRLAYVDGAEHGNSAPHLDQTMAVLNRPYVYFKRELLAGQTYTTPRKGTLRPLPFAAVPQHHGPQNTWADHQFDLYWRGNSCYGPRPRAAKAFLSQKWERPVRLGWFDEYTIPLKLINGQPFQQWECPRSQYIQEMIRAPMALSLRGMGNDCYRYWEIPYTKTVLFAQKTNQVIENNYVDGQEAIFFEYNLSNMISRFQMVLGWHPGALKAIAAAGMEKTLRYHTTARRAEYLLKECGL